MIHAIPLLFKEAAVASGGDPYFANVVLLAHGDGVNTGTTFINSAPVANALTGAGTPTTSTVQSKFGGSAIRIPTNTSRLTLANSIDLSSDSYTMECWMWIPANYVGDASNIVATNNNTFPNRWLFDAYIDATFLRIRLITTSNAVNFTSSATAAAATWHHIALSNDAPNNTIRCFLNGVQIGSRTAMPLVFHSPFTIASNSTAWAEAPYYLDEVRVTKGVARYVANFTPPTAPFPDS